jgi:hypothetical protein
LLSATAATPATEPVAVLQDLTDGADLDALHDGSMIARQGQAVSLNF